MNQAPQGQDGSIAIDEDVSHVFAAADFGFVDDEHQFEAVIITQVPMAGTLELDGVAVSDGQRIAIADIAQLVWTPPLNEFGSGLATLRFQVVDDGGTAGGGTDTDPTPRTLTFDVAPVPDAPDSGNRRFTINEDTPFQFDFALFHFDEPDGDGIASIIIDNITGAASSR